MDPGRNGDGRGVQPPQWRNGRPLPQRPITDGHGRFIPPRRGDLGPLDDRNITGRIGDIDRGWDRNDHGYRWYDWDGRQVCHHYDQWGYNWWGFYVGSAYFWTRYYDDMFWWYDPYWHRWCWMDNDRWWWQNPNGAIYIVEGGNYYRYNDDGGTVVVVPDQTPPITPPPGQVNVGNGASYYSADGSRMITIDPTDGSAYLYAPSAPAGDALAQGRFLASGVSTAQFAYSQGTTLQQINLTFSDGVTTGVVDPNGQRAVWVVNQTATLYNLSDPSVPSVLLSQQVAEVQMIDQAGQDASGAPEQVLEQINVYQNDGTTAYFDRDGNQTWGRFGMEAYHPSATPQGARRNALASPALKMLQDGVAW